MNQPMISTTEAFDALLARLATVTEIAFDTEFHGEDAYWPRLMLVQLATRKEVVVVDAISPAIKPRLPELFTAICAPGKVVIGHALEHDLAFGMRTAGVLPSRVFDTQVAAGLAGRIHPIGLGVLLRDTLGVEVDKSFAASNWAARPLHADQLAYAMGDVRHLLALTDKLGQELAKKGRLAWAVEECGRLLEADRYASLEPREAWKSVRRRQTVEGAELMRLRELAAEREHLARELDQPRRVVLSDDALVDLAHRGPREERSLRNKVLRRNAPNVGHFGARWLAAIARAAELPLVEPPAPPSAREELAIGLLRLRARAVAEDAGVAPGLLTEPIEERWLDVVRDAPADEDALLDRLGLDGWRAELLAAPLAGLVGGQAAARLGAGRTGLELSWS